MDNHSEIFQVDANVDKMYTADLDGKEMKVFLSDDVSKRF